VQIGGVDRWEIKSLEKHNVAISILDLDLGTLFLIELCSAGLFVLIFKCPLRFHIGALVDRSRFILSLSSSTDQFVAYGFSLTAPE
jgi:hypothetical protein